MRGTSKWTQPSTPIIKPHAKYESTYVKTSISRKDMTEPNSINRRTNAIIKDMFERPIIAQAGRAPARYMSRAGDLLRLRSLFFLTHSNFVSSRPRLLSPTSSKSLLDLFSRKSRVWAHNVSCSQSGTHRLISTYSGSCEWEQVYGQPGRGVYDTDLYIREGGRSFS